MAKLIFLWTFKRCGPEGPALLPVVFRDASARRELARLFDVMISGERLLEHLLAQGRADHGRLEVIGRDCLGLDDALIEEFADVLDAFDEDAELYRASLRSRLPRWLIGGTACGQAVPR